MKWVDWKGQRRLVSQTRKERFVARARRRKKQRWSFGKRPAGRWT